MNRNYKYSKNSLAKIKTVHPKLQLLCKLAISIANCRKAHCPDFGISHGLRTQEEQLELYKKGRVFIDHEYFIKDENLVVTNCDGVNNKSNHQNSLAIDFYCFVDGRANYDLANMALVVVAFYEAAADLGIKMNSGMNYKSISDSAHIEIELD